MLPIRSGFVLQSALSVPFASALSPKSDDRIIGRSFRAVNVVTRLKRQLFSFCPGIGGVVFFRAATKNVIEEDTGQHEWIR